MDRPRALGLAFLGVWAFGLAWNGGVTVEATAILTLAMAALNVAAARLLPDPIRLSRAGLWFLAALGGLFVLQLLPLAPLLFPVTHGWRQTHGIAGAGWWPGTADTFRTLLALTTVCLYALSALFVLRLRQTGLGASTMLRAAVAVLALEAIYGLVQQFAGLKDVPFYGTRPYPDSASGTLVSRNNFGGLMAVGLVLAIAKAWSRFNWPVRNPSDAGKPRWLRQLEGAVLWTLAVGLFAVALVISRSRGAVLAGVGGIVILPFAYRGRGSVAAVGALLLLAAGAASIAGLQPLVERFGALDPYDLTADGRWTIFATTVQAALRQPLLGFGWGSHPVAYHPYQPPSLPGQIHHAHNEYVNVFFEAGAAGALLLVAALGFWFVRTWRAQRPLPGPDRLQVTAAIAAVAVTALHSFVDFDLRIPSNGMLFALLIGLGTAAARGGEARPKLAQGVGATALAAIAALFAGLDPMTIVERARGSNSAAEMERLSMRALALSPYEYRAAWAAARAAQIRNDPPTADRRFETAAALWPAHSGVQRAAGLWFAESRDDRAIPCFHRLFEQESWTVSSVMEEIGRSDERLVPPIPAAKAAYAAWLVDRGEWPEGVQVFERGVPAVPANAALYDQFAAALDRAGQWGVEAGVLDRRLEVKSDAAAYGTSARAWLHLGVYDRALERASTASRIDLGNPEWWRLKGDVLRGKGERLSAAEAYTEALARAPMELAVREARGWTYLELQMWDLAASDFGAALRSKPLERSLVLGMAKAQLGMGHPDWARVLLDDFLARWPQDSEVKAFRAGLGP